MQLSENGNIAFSTWGWLGKQYPFVDLDACVVMPNHIHGILLIHDDRRGGSRTAATPKCKPLGRLIGAFKTVSTKQINGRRHTPGASFWQRNYYEHILRNDADLHRVREYVTHDPLQCALDSENPLISNP